VIVLSTDFDAPRQSSRLAGAVGALLLQAAFLSMFLSSMPKITQPIETARELTYILHRRAQPPLTLTPPRTAPPTHHATPVIEPLSPVIAPPATALPDLRDFGQALNDCTPERLASLRPEQKARCQWLGAGLPPPEDMAAPHSLVKDEPHWETEFAHEQSPLWLPCTGFSGDTNIINLYCLGVMAAKGTLADKNNWPVYNGAGKNQ
jgi:hypothetical protein